MPSVHKKKIAAVVALAAVAACAFWGYSQYSDRHTELKLYGSIDMRTVDLAFEESGRLQSVLFEEGSRVKAGDIVAKLDDTRYRIARDQAQAQVGVAQAQLDLLLAGTRVEEIDVAKARLKATEANLILSERTCKRYRDMGKAASALARDQACYTAGVDRATRDEAKRTLEMLLAGTRIEEIDVAYGSQPCPALSGLPVSFHCPAFQSWGDKFLCGIRPVRIRFRIHCVHALYDVFLRRRVQDIALFPLYRLYGVEHDAAGDGCRLPPGMARVCGFLLDGGGVLSCDNRGNAVCEGGAGIWEKQMNL